LNEWKKFVEHNAGVELAISTRATLKLLSIKPVERKHEHLATSLLVRCSPKQGVYTLTGECRLDPSPVVVPESSDDSGTVAT
jgi:hypothetical protein